MSTRQERRRLAREAAREPALQARQAAAETATKKRAQQIGDWLRGLGLAPVPEKTEG